MTCPGETRLALDPRQEKRDSQDDGKRRQCPPYDPPGAGSECLQHEGGDQAGCNDTEPGARGEAAEQEVCPLGVRLRKVCGERAASDERYRCSDPRADPPQTE